MTAHSRTISLLKTISWRLMGIVGTVLIVWLLLKQPVSLALTIGGIEIAIKLVVYYAHERLWEHIVEWWQNRGTKGTARAVQDS